MCTVLVRYDPDGAWPLLLAFVRDEDRNRPTDPPGAWWPELPDVVGGHDGIAGGTWLAVDTGEPPRAAFLTDQFDPDATVPDPASSPSRGGLPLAAVRRGADFRLEHDPADDVRRYQPFHVVTATWQGARLQLMRWSWDGSTLEHERIAPGDHVVASRATTIPGERQRRERLLARLERVGAVDPRPGLTPHEAWRDWIGLLDGRHVQHGRLDELTVHGIDQRPGFGTVGASLVALAPTAHRYDVNLTRNLTPAAWRSVTSG